MAGEILNRLKKHKRLNSLLKSNMFLAVSVNLAFLVLVACFCDFKYEVSDDFIMASILSGAFGGSPNPHMIFVNIIIGYCLMPLYYLAPSISWYFVFQVMLIFLASILVIYFLLVKLEKPKAFMLAAIYLLFFIGDAYVLMQFTKTAMIAVLAGGLIFVWSLFSKQKKGIIFSGATLCLLGTMLRFQVIYIAGVFLIFVLMYEFIRLFKGPKQTDMWQRFAKISVCGILLISSAFLLHKIDQKSYDNETYRFFYEYCIVRAQIVDYKDYGYETYADELTQIGITENDYKMLKTWNFADPDFFSLDTMRSISEIISNHYQSRDLCLSNLIEDLRNRGISKYPIYQGCLLLLILGVFLNRDRWWCTLISFAIGFLYLLYFTYRERCIYRIEYCIFLGIILSGFYYWHLGPVNNIYSINKVCGIIILLCIIGSIAIYAPSGSYKTVNSATRRAYIYNVFNSSWDYDEEKIRSVINFGKPPNGLLEEISTNKQNFYFFDFNTTIQTLYYEWPPWETVSKDFFDNCGYLAGIASNFPDVVATLGKNDVANPLKDLVKTHVYLVDNNSLDMKLGYLKAHYYPDVHAELYKEVDGYKIWKLYEY